MNIQLTFEVPGLGAKIRDLRLQSHKSSTQLAASAGLSVGYWYRLESETMGDLPLATLRRIEDALGVSLVGEIFVRLSP